MADSPDDPGNFDKVNSVVFDLDGTLIDSMPGIESSLRTAFRSVNRAMPDVDLRRVIGPPITVIARLIEPSLSDEEIATIERSYRATYDGGGWQGYLAYPAVADTLTALHQCDVCLFIVTNKPMVPTSRILEHLGIDSAFSEVVSRDSRFPPYLSKSDMLGDLMRRRQLVTSATLMVGDTREDLDAAQKNNLDFLHVTYGYGSIATSPGRSIQHFSEIALLLSLSDI